MNCKHCGKPLGWSPHEAPYDRRMLNLAGDAHLDCDGAAQWEAAKVEARKRHGELACTFCGEAFWETPSRPPTAAGLHPDCEEGAKVHEAAKAAGGA